jgi:hypothetical protein
MVETTNYELNQEKFWEKFAGKYDQDNFYILD